MRPTNVCAQPNVFEIASHVSHSGNRVPASISRQVAGLTPNRHAACPTD